MTDTDHIIRRGMAAGDILRSEAITEAFDEMKGNLHAQIDAMQQDDSENVMAIVRQIRAIRCLRSKLESWEQQGRREQMMLEKINGQD